MISQSAHFAEVFTKARDCAITDDLGEATQAHLLDARRLMPPSKAHVKRNERAKRENFRDPVTHRVCSAETLVLREQNDHYKRMMAEIGASRTVKPTDDGILYNAGERGVWNHVPHGNHAEQTPASYAEHMAVEQAKIDVMRERLRRAFEIEREAVPTTLARRLQRWEKEFSLD